MGNVPTALRDGCGSIADTLVETNSSNRSGSHNDSSNSPTSPMNLCTAMGNNDSKPLDDDDDDFMSLREINPTSALFARAMLSEVNDNPNTMTPKDMAAREKQLLRAQQSQQKRQGNLDTVKGVIDSINNSGVSEMIRDVTGMGPPGEGPAALGPSSGGGPGGKGGGVNSRGPPLSVPPNAISESRAQLASSRQSETNGRNTITIGLSLSRRHSNVGHPDTVTRQTAFDFNELQDRAYRYVSSTDSSGWRAGGGESGAPFSHPSDDEADVGSLLGSSVDGGTVGDNHSLRSGGSNPRGMVSKHKAAAPDTVHIPIIQIDADSAASVDAIIAALARGEIFIPHMSIMPESLSVNGVSPPDLVVRFGCERNDDLPPDEWPNWCLEFMHNQLFDYFSQMGARWTRRPFQITLAKKVRWKTVKHMNKYFASSEKVINAWREKGPQYLDPQLSYIEGGATPEEVARPHGIYLLRNGRATNYFAPNFEPPYTTKMTRSLLMNVMSKSWDKKRRDWSNEPNERLITANSLISGMCGCHGDPADFGQGGGNLMQTSDGTSPIASHHRGLPQQGHGGIGAQRSDASGNSNNMNLLQQQIHQTKKKKDRKSSSATNNNGIPPTISSVPSQGSMISNSSSTHKVPVPQNYRKTKTHQDQNSKQRALHSLHPQHVEDDDQTTNTITSFDTLTLDLQNSNSVPVPQHYRKTKPHQDQNSKQRALHSLHPQHVEDDDQTTNTITSFDTLTLDLQNSNSKQQDQQQDQFFMNAKFDHDPFDNNNMDARSSRAKQQRPAPAQSDAGFGSIASMGMSSITTDQFSQDTNQALGSTSSKTVDSHTLATNQISNTAKAKRKQEKDKKIRGKGTKKEKMILEHVEEVVGTSSNAGDNTILSPALSGDAEKRKSRAAKRRERRLMEQQGQAQSEFQPAKKENTNNVFIPKESPQPTIKTNNSSNSRSRKPTRSNSPPSRSNSPDTLIYSVASHDDDGNRSIGVDSHNTQGERSLMSFMTRSTQEDQPEGMTSADNSKQHHYHNKPSSGSSSSRSKTKPIQKQNRQKQQQQYQEPEDDDTIDENALSIMPSSSSTFCTLEEAIPSDEELFAIGWAKAMDPNSDTYYYFTLDRSTIVWDNPLLKQD